MRALISVSDKTGVVEFAKELSSLGFEIIATGGTKKALDAEGIKTIYVEDVTGFPEILDGRVKTLHPNIHGGILAKRDDDSHMESLKKLNIETIDLLCVNLYPFKETIKKDNVELAEAIEQIDIGGPSMLRSAAKNNKFVYVVCDPSDYKRVIEALKSTKDNEKLRLELAYKVFAHTASYDIAIANYFAKQLNNDDNLFIEGKKVNNLRYGENPHQNASFYQIGENESYSLANASFLQGKELSYNNIQDANAALMITSEFSEPFVVGLKHMNPCGAACGKDNIEAWKKAYEADPVSIFGGIVCTNREISEELALLMKPVFLEVVIAPKISDGAKKVFAKKKNLRVIEVDMTKLNNEKQYVSVHGGLLVQDQDINSYTTSLTKEMNVTENPISDSLVEDLNFAWKIAKHTKSNAIVLASNKATCGIGAGQMNRIGSLEIAYKEALEFNHDKNLVLASDGFFPFSDCVEFAAKHNVVAIAQPGGSIRDEDSIKACNEAEIPMLFSGRRHFKH